MQARADETHAEETDIALSGDEAEFLHVSREAADEALASERAGGDEPDVVRQLRQALPSLRRLVIGQVVLHKIEIEGARVLLEVHEDGRANWDFETQEEEPTAPLELTVGQIELDDVVLVYRDPTLPRPL